MRLFMTSLISKKQQQTFPFIIYPFDGMNFVIHPFDGINSHIVIFGYEIQFSNHMTSIPLLWLSVAMKITKK